MQENKAVVARFVKALGSGDVETLKATISEDIIAICPGTSAVSGTRYHADVCAAAGLFTQITKSGLALEILALTAEDDRVACEMQGRSILVSGAAYDNQYCMVFTVRDGRIVRMMEYMDTLLAQTVLAPLFG